MFVSPLTATLSPLPLPSLGFPPTGKELDLELTPRAVRFYGQTENAREVEMDMREMVDKVKKGEPLYGVSELTPYMQGVAARQSRYSALFMGTLPWFNFVNHNQHGVDTAKYYRQAEREVVAERAEGGANA
jgi:hypothetical protein